MASCELTRSRGLMIVSFIAACTALFLSHAMRQSRVYVSGDVRASDDRGGNVPEFMVDGIFPGAREWHDHWSYATRKGGEGVDRSHAHDDYVASAAESLSGAALRHIDEMRERYEGVAALPDFYARGLGWIRDRLGMVLTVVIAGDPAPSSANDSNGTALRPGTVSIYIVDTIGKLRCGGGDDAWIDRQPPLTMWVRANGPEIFAGTALPHRLERAAPGARSPCAWRYDFEAERSGTYSIHVKVLNFNGFADFEPEECETEKLPSRNVLFDGQRADGDAMLLKLESMNEEAVRELSAGGNYSHHRGLSGFKMYGVIDACCEACTRARNCKMWSVPGGRHYDNCELYFDRIEDDLDFLDREDGRYLGRRRNYSYIQQNVNEFPDIRRRKMRRRRLAVSPKEMKKIWPIKEAPAKGLPRRGAVTYFIGCGWSSLMTFENPCHYPSDDLVFGSGKKVLIVSDVTDPGVEKALRPCTLADEEIDSSDGRWVRHPFPDDSVCGEVLRDTSVEKFKAQRPAYRGDLDPRCWHRDDLTGIANTCSEPGCQWVIRRRWMTDLKRDARWFGLWEQRGCAYRDMGDDLIQKCVRAKNIGKISTKGASISNMLTGYLNQKLKGIEMTGDRSIFLDTLKMPHLLWHNNVEKHRQKLEDGFPDASAAADEHYWLTGFYFTSEREPHTQVDRSLQYSRIARDVLAPRGYRMINAFDVTAAFAFDTDAQSDGLHIDGPPSKVIVTKLFHHLCRDVM